MKQVFTGLIKLTITSILLMTLFACGGAEERKVKYLEKGKAYLADKNYDKARVEIKNVLQIDPKYAEAYYIMGQLEEKDKELVRAIGNYKKAIELAHDFNDAKIKLAKIYVIAGTEELLTEAKELVNQVKQANQNNTEADLIRATIEYKSGSKQKAKDDIESVLDKNENLVEGISLLATIYMAEGEEDKTIDLLKKGAQNNPKNITLRVSLATLLSKNKNYDDAEKYLKEAINIEPDEYALKLALSKLYAISNEVEKAESILRQSIKDDKNDAKRYLVLVEFLASKISVKRADEELQGFIKAEPDLYELKFSQAMFYKKIGKHEESKSVLKKIIEDKSYDLEGINARNYLARILHDEGDLKGAKKYVDEVISEYPNNNNALLLSSKLALTNLESTTAINNLRTVIKNQPKNPEAALLLAQAHELNSESNLAEAQLKKSIEVNPVNEQTHVNYARYLASKGRLDEAVKVVDKALIYFKTSYDLMDIKLKILVSQKKESDVVALLNIMEQTNGNRPDVNIKMGHYYLSKKNYDIALEHYEKAYEVSSDKYKPLELIIKTYLYNKQPDQALNRLKERLEKNSDDAIAHHLTGQVYLAQGKIDLAREKFQLALKNQNAWFVPYASLAGTYIQENNLEQAANIYLGAIDKLSNKVPAQMQLAGIYEKQTKFSKAMEVYISVLDNNSSNKIAANNYASLLIDHGEHSDLPKALELTKSFDKLNQPALQDTLGWAYAKTGDTVKAVELLKPVVDKAPKVAIFRYHLGYSLYHMGDKAAAKSHLEVAVSSEQTFYGKDEAKELLKTI